MRDFKPRALMLLLSLAGCGRQVVEFGTDTSAVTVDATLADSTVDTADLARTDAARTDASLPDAMLPDAMLPDAALPDASLPDAMLPDAMLPDAMLPDAMLPDAALPDAALPTPPTVVSTLPEDEAIGVPLDSTVSAVFSEPMDPLSLDSPAVTFGVVEVLSGLPVPGNVVYENLTATFTPDDDLAPDTDYTATITTAAVDQSGVPLVFDAVWTFTTGDVPDELAPFVTLTVPGVEVNVPVDQMIEVTFSEPMDVDTMRTTTFVLIESESMNEVSGMVAYDLQNNLAYFTPENELAPDTEYTFTVTSDARDLAGNALVVPAVDGLPTPNPFTFRTAALVIPPPPLAINLRGVATFGIASRAGLTSTGVTRVNGDVALYPLDLCADATGNAGAAQTCLVQTYSSPTGLTVNGSIYFAGDPFDNGGTANSVTNDLNIAWTEAMNKVDTQGPVVADEIGGKILAPGVYHNAALALSAGAVATLDAGNDANAVFVFKVDSSFVDSGTLLLPSRIELVNGAQARNVWFVTGLDVTIGSGTIWNGNILAGRTATILDGSAVLGRVLAGASGAGAITLTGAASPSVTSITVPE